MVMGQHTVDLWLDDPGWNPVILYIYLQGGSRLPAIPKRLSKEISGVAFLSTLMLNKLCKKSQTRVPKNNHNVQHIWIICCYRNFTTLYALIYYKYHSRYILIIKYHRTILYTTCDNNIFLLKVWSLQIGISLCVKIFVLSWSGMFVNFVNIFLSHGVFCWIKMRANCVNMDQTC